MCGHVGILKTTALTMEDERMFTNLLFLDALRGMDATGVCAVEAHVPSKATRMYKAAVAAPEFINLPGYVKLLTKPNSVLIGHNRAATKGKVIDSNSHPFNFKHITLAHNGTLTDYSTLPGYNKFGVDSEVLAHAFADVDDPKKVLESVVGAYAIVWYNQRNNTLSFARNNERPFTFAISDDKTGIAWASEEGMLTWALNRHSKSKWKLFTLPTEKIHTFQLGGKTIPGAVVEDFKEKKFQKSYNSYQGNYAGYYGSRVSNKNNAAYSDYPSLAELGYTKGDKVYMVFSGAHLQSTINGKHTYNCIFEDYDPSVKVSYKCFSVPADMIDATDEEAVYEGEVSYVTRHHNKDYHVVVNNLTKIEFDNNDIKLLTHDEEEYVLGPNNTCISVSEFKKLTQGGCINCAAPINVVDANDVMWANDGEDPVCPDCAASIRYPFGVSYGH